MKRVITAIAVAVMLSGCSASSALTGLIGSKPEITAQAGAENVKQTVGVTAKQDTSSKQESTIKDSAVGKVDTSNKKKVSASSIQAETITADKIEIGNKESSIDWSMIIAVFFVGIMSGVAATTIYATSRNKKGA